MKSAVALCVCKILLIQTFCVLGQQTASLPTIDNKYPCRNTTDVVMGLKHGVPSEKINQFHVNINKIFFSCSILKLSFDSDVYITFVDEQNKWITMIIPADDVMEKRFLSLETGFNFIVQGTTSKHPNLISILINNVEFCHDPIKNLFKKYIRDEIGHVPNDTYKRLKYGKSNFQCGRRKNNRNTVTNPISAIDYPQDTGSAIDGAANLGDWPWHAALYIIPSHLYSKSQKSTLGSTYVCGGTLIARNVVLTGESCIKTVIGFQRTPHIFYVALGRNILYNDHDDKAVVVNVERIIIPPKDPNFNFLLDIALLKLESEVQFSDTIRPACLWHRRDTEPTSEEIVGVLAGWGFTNNDDYSQPLQQVNLPMVSNNICSQSDPELYQHILSEKRFCAGYYNNATAPCNGDDGGAYLVFIPDNTTDQNNTPGSMSGTWYVRGIMTLSVLRDGVCDENYYAIFADEEKYADWIDSYLDG